MAILSFSCRVGLINSSIFGMLTSISGFGFGFGLVGDLFGLGVFLIAIYCVHQGLSVP